MYIFYTSRKLNKYPVITIPMNIARSLGFKTLLNNMLSGKLRPVTAIMKASAVPMLTPALVNSLTRGITPAALEYSGTPIITAINTAKGLFFPEYFANEPVGTHPCITPPIAIPIIPPDIFYITI
jgi:hypothetical protein